MCDNIFDSSYDFRLITISNLHFFARPTAKFAGEDWVTAFDDTEEREI